MRALLRLIGFTALCVLLIAAAPINLTTSDSPVADAAMQGERVSVRSMLRQGGDVNAAQGDGMTALHWAAVKSDVEMAEMLLYAGANVKATTRLGAYTSLFLASKSGHPAMVETLLAAGADVNAATNTGATPLMLAAASGSVEAVTLLSDEGAELNATESKRSQTALMFAASYGRAGVIAVLVERGADVAMATRLLDVPALAKEDRAALRAKLQKQREAREKAVAGPEEKTEKTETAEAEKKGGPNFFSRMFGWMKPGKSKKAASALPRRPRRSYGELVGIQGGLTPLLLAARGGHAETVEALLAADAAINQLSEGTKTSPLLIATMNGHYDLAKLLLDRGADPNLANEPAGVTPLYAAINIWYAPHTSYPQPTAQFQQSLTHLELIQALLEGGAEPNVRLKKKIWFSAYNFDQSGLDETGATPFWRAAYASDVAAMRLLKDHGADPSIWTKKPPERPRVADEQARELEDVSGLPPVPENGPAIAPIHAASGAGYGEGFAGNEHRNHPAGFLAGVRFLVEECGADVNARDHEGNSALHSAAARGDVELIEYLVSKGADVTAVNREGHTTADMANGPVQRIQPFPGAVALLTSLGAVNNNKCVSC